MRFSNKQAKKDLKQLHMRELPLLFGHGILIKEVGELLQEINGFLRRIKKPGEATAGFTVIRRTMAWMR